jgi:heme O synthase-like polyprenyltransferase
MKKLTEIIIALVLVIILFLKADPFKFLMPNEIQMILLCVLAAAFALYAGLIFREKPADEREALHLYRASRVAYIAGTLALTVAIIIQDVFHQLDPVLLAVLGIMIVTKLVVLLYSRYKN